MTGCKWHYLTQNHAETRADHPDVTLRTPSYDLPFNKFFDTIISTIKALPHWRIVSHDPERGEILAERKTALFKFTDDIAVKITQKKANNIVLHIRSASRVGKGDFGQNARNIRELLEGIERKTEKEFEPSHSEQILKKETTEGLPPQLDKPPHKERD